MLNVNYMNLSEQGLINQAVIDMNNYEEGQKYQNVRAYTRVQLGDIEKIEKYLQRAELLGNDNERAQATLARKRAQEILTRDARMNFNKKEDKTLSYAEIKMNNIKRGIEASQNRSFGCNNRKSLFR